MTETQINEENRLDRFLPTIKILVIEFTPSKNIILVNYDLRRNILPKYTIKHK